jgi:hypothetical protein
MNNTKAVINTLDFLYDMAIANDSNYYSEQFNNCLNENGLSCYFDLEGNKQYCKKEELAMVGFGI